VRFSHTVFALPFALAAMLVAARDNRGWPGWKTFGLILAAMVCARTCAMAFNRIVGPQIRRAESAHGKPASADRTNFAGERDSALRFPARVWLPPAIF
jgi:hypothetical protein